MNKTLSTLTLALMTAWGAQAMAETHTPPAAPVDFAGSALKVGDVVKATSGANYDINDLTLNNPEADAGLMVYASYDKTDPNATLVVNGPVNIDVTSDKKSETLIRSKKPIPGVGISIMGVDTTFKDNVTVNSTATNAEKTSTYTGGVLIRDILDTPKADLINVAFEKGLTIDYSTKTNADPGGETASVPNSALMASDAMVTAHDVDITATGGFPNSATILSGLTNIGNGVFTSEGDHFNIDVSLPNADGNGKGIYLFGSDSKVEINNKHVNITVKSDPSKTTWNTGFDLYRQSKLIINSDDITITNTAKTNMGVTLYNEASAEFNSKNVNIDLEGEKTYGVFTSNYKGGHDTHFTTTGDNFTVDAKGTERAVGLFLWETADFNLGTKDITINAGAEGNTKQGQGIYVLGNSTLTTTADNDNFTVNATETESGGDGIKVTAGSTVNLNSKNADITLNRQSTNQSAAVTVDGTFKTSADTALNVKSTSTDKQNIGITVNGNAAKLELLGNNSIVTVTDAADDKKDPTAAAVKVTGTGSTVTIGSDTSKNYIAAQTTDDKDWGNTTQAGNAFVIDGGNTVTVKGQNDIVGDATITNSTLDMTTADVENRWHAKEITVDGATANLNWSTKSAGGKEAALIANVTATNGAHVALDAKLDAGAKIGDGDTMIDGQLDGADGMIDLHLENASWKAHGLSTINKLTGTNASVDMSADDVNNVFINHADTSITIDMDLRPSNRKQSGVLYVKNLGPNGKLIFDFDNIENIDWEAAIKRPLRFATTSDSITKDKIEVLNFPGTSGDGIYNFEWGEDTRPDAGTAHSGSYVGNDDQFTEAQIDKLFGAGTGKKYWVITATHKELYYAVVKPEIDQAKKELEEATTPEARAAAEAKIAKAKRKLPISIVVGKDLYDLEQRVDANTAALDNTNPAHLGQTQILENHEVLINANKQALADHQTILDQHDAAIKANETGIAQARASIDANTQTINEQAGLINQNRDGIANNKTAIESNTQSIAEHKKQIDKNAEKLVDQDQAIDGLEQTIAQHTPRIETNTTEIEKLKNRFTLSGRAIQQLETRIEDTAKEMREGLAINAALTGLFKPYNVERFNVTVGFGGYKSATAIAVGTGYRYNERLAVSVGVATSLQKPGALAAHVSMDYNF